MPATKTKMTSAGLDPGIEPFLLSAIPCNHGTLRIATRQMSQLFDDVVGASGLKTTQHGLLSYIDQMRGPTMKELARQLVMDLSALGHTLKPLVRDGYVELVADERDRRAKRVLLTKAGRAKLTETRKLWRVAQGRVETALGAETAAHIRGLLTMIASDAFADAFRAGRRLNEGRGP